MFANRLTEKILFTLLFVKFGTRNYVNVCFGFIAFVLSLSGTSQYVLYWQMGHCNFAFIGTIISWFYIAWTYGFWDENIVFFISVNRFCWKLAGESIVKIIVKRGIPSAMMEILNSALIMWYLALVQVFY